MKKLDLIKCLKEPGRSRRTHPPWHLNLLPLPIAPKACLAACLLASVATRNSSEPIGHGFTGGSDVGQVTCPVLVIYSPVSTSCQGLCLHSFSCQPQPEMTINPLYLVPSILPYAFHCGWLRLIEAKYGTAFGPATATAFSGIVSIYVSSRQRLACPETSWVKPGQTWSKLKKRGPVALTPSLHMDCRNLIT